MHASASFLCVLHLVADNVAHCCRSYQHERALSATDSAACHLLGFVCDKRTVQLTECYVVWAEIRLPERRSCVALPAAFNAA